MITIKKILVPMELSNVSVPAIGYASSLAKNLDAEVILLHVMPIDRKSVVHSFPTRRSSDLDRKSVV